jgi:hypothetical protein
MSYPVRPEFLHPQNADTLLVSNLAECSLKTFDFPNIIHSPMINGGRLEYSIDEFNKRKLKKGSNT